MTVNQLLTGPTPLSHREFIEWAAYKNVKHSKEKQAQTRANARRGRRR